MANQRRVIRPLRSDADWEQYTTIAINAYPGIQASGNFTRQRFKDRGQQMHADPIIAVYGLFEAGRLQGIMRLYDFTMKLHSARMLVGGIGGVGVDLLEKKKHVAYDMMQFFLTHYRNKGAALTVLYPFRPDFYRQMGFGYGRKMNQYRVSPAVLPEGERHTVAFLESDSRQAFVDCYNRIMDGANGLIALSDFDLDTIFNHATLQKVGVWRDGRLCGYLLFAFEPVPNGNFLRNNIVVRAIQYENATALRALLAFLRAQADQIETVVFNTQDEDFHLLLSDPRNGSQRLIASVYHETNTQGVGIMYRVMDVPRLFALLADHDFGGQSGTLRLNLTDSFWPACAGAWTLRLENGRVRLDPKATPEVEISLNIAEFSSLITGATTFRGLLAYGLADISDSSYTEVVDRMFYTPHKPYCFTSF